MTQSAQEIIIKPGSEISVVDLDINSKKITELSLRCKNLPQDLTNDENYRMSQDVINEAREMRGKIKTKGKELKDDANKWQKKVVAEEKRLDGEIVKFLDPEASRKKAYDDEVKAEKERKKMAEQLRKDKHLESINTIRLFISMAQGKSSEEIENIIEALNAVEVDASYEEFEKEAGDVWDDTDLALQRLLINAQTTEEADRQRIAEDARLRKEREAVAAEKAENERIRLANEEITRKNEADAQAIVDAEAEKDRQRIADLKATEEVTQIADDEPEVETENSIGATESVKKKISNDNSVVDMARENTINAIEDIVLKCRDLTGKGLAGQILLAVTRNEIPNVKYDIF